MSNVGTVRTQSELWADALNLGQPTRVNYFQYCQFDSSPAAQEIFINGVNGQRLWLPTDSVIVGRAFLAAWNITDGDNPAGSLVDFMAENDGGTVAFTPTNFSGTDGNPIIVRTGGVGTLTVTANNTNKAIQPAFTGTASKNYYLRGFIDFVVVTANSHNANYLTATS